MQKEYSTPNRCVCFSTITVTFMLMFVLSGCKQEVEQHTQDKNQNTLIENHERGTSHYLGYSIDVKNKAFRTALEQDDSRSRDVAWIYNKNFSENTCFYDGIILCVEAYIIKVDDDRFFLEFHVQNLGNNPYCGIRGLTDEKLNPSQSARIVLFTGNEEGDKALKAAEISKQILLMATCELYDHLGKKNNGMLYLIPNQSEHTAIGRALQKNAGRSYVFYQDSFLEGSRDFSSEKAIIRMYHPEFTLSMLDLFNEGFITLYLHVSYTFGPYNHPGCFEFTFPVSR